MLLEFCAVAFIGIMAGSLINMLADALPTRQPLRLPRYADGRRRPRSAWLGISAFMFNMRRPQDLKSSAAALCAGSPSNGPGSALLSWRYPLTEIASAILMLLLYADSRDELALLSSAALIKFAYIALLLLITVIDIEHRRIPFAVTLPLGALALVDAVMIPATEPGLPAAVTGGLVGFAVFYAVFLGGFVYARILNRIRGEALQGSVFGFGDVLLMAAIGAMIGYPSIIMAITISVFAGGVAAIVVIIARFIETGRYQPFDKIAYGPFVVGSAITLMLVGN